jgi:hypothetical protein
MLSTYLNTYKQAKTAPRCYYGYNTNIIRIEKALIMPNHLILTKKPKATLTKATKNKPNQLRSQQTTSSAKPLLQVA